jgi:hypothetical protein
MAAYLVELYVSCADGDAVEQCTRRARLAAQELTRSGIGVRLARSIFVPEDETCFLLFEAVDAESVQDALARAGLPFERITDAVSTSGAGL